MKIKKQYIILMLSLLFIILGTTISYGSYQAESKTVESGANVSITVTSSEALDAYNLDLKDAGGLTFNSCSKTESGAIISIKGSSIGYMNASGKTTTLGTYSFTAPKVTEKKTYTVTFLVDKKTSVTTSVTVNPVEQPKPVTPTPEPEPEKPSTNNNIQPETPPAAVKKSSEARLKNFGINPSEYDFSGFSKNTSKENWTVEVPNNISEVEVYATAKDNKAKVEGTGKVSLKEGANPVKVKVTAEDGTTKTYTLTITRKSEDEQAKEDGEARLRSLGIKPEEYDFTGFDSEKTEYNVEVPNEVEEIEVYAKAMNSSAQITGTGIITLEEGANELKIEVIAVDGTKKTYTLSVTRAKSEEITGTTEEPFGLSSLSIKGLKLSPSFKVGTHEYTATLTEDLNLLEVIAKANIEDATVEIIGNENLQQGENVITILVKNKETEENATYQITVTKNVTVVEEVVQTSWLKPATWGQEEIIKIAIIVVLIILIIIAIILKIKISKESKEQRYVELPGGEELDKAITEHQELSDESNYEDVVETTVENNYTLETQGEQNYIEEIAMNKFGIEEDDDIKPKRRGRHF